MTCDYLRRLRSPWSPTGIAAKHSKAGRPIACHNQVFGSQVITGGPIASNWGFMSCDLCLVFVSDSSFLSSLDVSQSDYVRFVRILPSDEFLSFIPL